MFKIGHASLLFLLFSHNHIGSTQGSPLHTPTPYRTLECTDRKEKIIGRVSTKQTATIHTKCHVQYIYNRYTACNMQGISSLTRLGIYFRSRLISTAMCKYQYLERKPMRCTTSTVLTFHDQILEKKLIPERVRQLLTQK